MTDWIRLIVPAALFLVSCGGQVGDTAEAGGVGAGGGSVGGGGAVQGGGGQGNAGAGFAGTSGMAGAAGSIAGSSGSKDATNACVVFPAAEPPTPSADPLITFVFHSFFVGDVDWSGQGDGNAWQLLGRNLDGVTSTGVKDTPCAKPGGALEDGTCGQDNTLGRGLYASSSYHTQRMRDGAFSVALQIDPGHRPRIRATRRQTGMRASHASESRTASEATRPDSASAPK